MADSVGISKDLIQYFNAETGVFRVKATISEDIMRQYKDDDLGMPVSITFEANGHEWRNWGDVQYFPVRSDWRDVSDVDEVLDITKTKVREKIRWGSCLTDPGRKRPPYQKEQKMFSLIDGWLDNVNIKKQMFTRIQSLIEEAQSLYLGEDAHADRVKELEMRLAAAEKEAKRTDIESVIMESVVSAITPNIVEKVNQRIGEITAVLPQELIVKINQAEHHLGPGVRHSKFEQVLSALVAGEPVWLKGDAGTGKSFMCEQIAQAMGAEYFCTGSIMDEYAGLKGFIDANGVKHGTEFTRALDAMEAGREVVMVFDEADGSTPEIMLAVNNFLSGGVIECMGHAYKMGSNIHIVACGNTAGRGGDVKYTRSIIDEATLDRFLFIEIDYDRNIELLTAGGDNDIADFARKLRDAAAECGVELLVTYRAIKRIARLSQIWDKKQEVLRASIVRGLDDSDIMTLSRAMSAQDSANEWCREFARMAA